MHGGLVRRLAAGPEGRRQVPGHVSLGHHLHGVAVGGVVVVVAGVRLLRHASGSLLELVGAARHTLGDEVNDLADVEHDAQGRGAPPNHLWIE